MKQTLILALIILTETACNDGCPCEDNVGVKSAPLPPVMLQQQEIPTQFIPDSMWEWHNWVGK